MQTALLLYKLEFQLITTNYTVTGQLEHASQLFETNIEDNRREWKWKVSAELS